MCYGAVIGAVCSLVILLPPQPFWAKLLFSVFTSAIMTLACVADRGSLACLRMCGCLLLATLCYGGLMSCIWTFVSPRGIIMNNGAVYINIDPVTLIVCTAVFYMLSSGIASKLRRRTFEHSSCRIEITVGGKKAALDGIFDTGNLLREPFSGLPVIIAERRYIEHLLPMAFDAFASGHIPESDPDRKPESIRLVPYSSVGGSGLLAAFMPDSIKVSYPSGEKNARAYIGVSESSLGRDCHAVISPDAVE